MQVTFRVADFTLCVKQEEFGNWLLVREPFDRFLVEHDPDLVVSLRRGFTELDLAHRVFDSGQRWQLWRDTAGRKVFYVRSFNVEPSHVLVLPPGDPAGCLYLAPDGDGFGRPLFPLDFPLSEVLAIDLLGQQGGVLMHASAVKDGDQGYLFVGVSGAGKTTTAKLWAEVVPNAIPLSDDRLIIRRSEGQLRIFGTPWWGVGHFSSPESVSLAGIFVLRHAEENKLTVLRPMDAVKKLLVRAFPPLWDSAGMAFTLSFLQEVSESVPCYDFGFRPDAHAVEYIRSLYSK